MQHARSMATCTRSLPTNSPIPYYQPTERGYMSEGSQEGIYATSYIDPSEHTITIGGTETDRMSAFTGLDDYDTLFAARHGRGDLDPVPIAGDQKAIMSSVVPTHMAGPELINPMESMTPCQGALHSDQREQVKLQMASPSSDIIGEGAAIFMDMMKTILDALDKQVVTSPGSQKPTKESISSDEQDEIVEGVGSEIPSQKEDYPNLFLPIKENYWISDCFCGYSTVYLLITIRWFW